MEYLVNKEKVVLANSKTESLEVEMLKMRKDLIASVDESNPEKECLKVVTEELKTKKKLTA